MPCPPGVMHQVEARQGGVGTSTSARPIPVDCRRLPGSLIRRIGTDGHFNRRCKFADRIGGGQRGLRPCGSAGERSGSDTLCKGTRPGNASIECRSERADECIARACRVNDVDIRRRDGQEIRGRYGRQRAARTERDDDRTSESLLHRNGEGLGGCRQRVLSGERVGFVLVDNQYVDCLEERRRQRHRGRGVQHDACSASAGTMSGSRDFGEPRLELQNERRTRM